MMDQAALTLGLLALKEQINTEVGTEEPCLFSLCGHAPRVRRSDYIRCNKCGVNWLDEERHLRNYLNRNPAAARMDGRMLKSAETSKADAEKAG